METLPDAAVALVVSLVAAPAVLWALRRFKLLDIPTPRSSHQDATPRGGGVAPALACVLAATISTRLSGDSRTVVLVVAGCLGLIGLADDLHPRPALLRLLGQTAASLVALIWLLRGVHGGLAIQLLAGGAIVAWLVGYVNVFNFMDGINGLATTQVVVAGGYWWLVGTHEHALAFAAAGLIVTASAASFAPFNVPRAKMFLGDVGSYFLGGWLAVTAVLGIRAGIAPEAVIAPLAVFLADAGVTLGRRILRREPIWHPHKEHSYQRLVQAGWSHGRTTLAAGLVMAAVSALGALSLRGTPALRLLGDTVAVLILSGYLVLPEWQSSPSGPGAIADQPDDL